MKWGKRKNTIEKKHSNVKTQSIQSDKPDVKKMSNEELKNKIDRLMLESRYAELTTSKHKNKGKDFVYDLFEKSAKNIGTQLVTYAMGTAVNKLVGGDVVNPKKGQKDK